MIRLLPLIALLSITINLEAQTKFRLNDASRLVDVELEVGTCEDEVSQGRCGPLTVRFFRKGGSRSFQTVRLPMTNMWDSPPKANVTRRYDDQSVINFADFNFDGIDDVAICDGPGGGYGMPSYRIYLYSKAGKRFVYSPSFTRMNEGGLGMFETDAKKKMHFVFTKSGCCMHWTVGFDVINDRPRKIYELSEIIQPDGETVEITTMKRMNGKWRTWIKHEKASLYYKQ
jgi:hypothetical protein